MCGIAGLVSEEPFPEAAQLVARMRTRLAHRGPDAVGLHESPGCALGHARLSIIDLTGGDQPLYSGDRSAVTVVNGEIYNYRSLRSDLERRGCRFRTNSDSEVLVHLFRERSDLGFLDEVEGMFAFAVYDSSTHTLWLARDRTGKKPLYYWEQGASLAFASEVQALLELPWNRDLDLEAMACYLRYQSVPAPRTAWKGIRQLEPGHVLRFTPGGHSQLLRYWTPPLLGSAGEAGRELWAEELEARLRGAVERRLISDVPLGAFLSGGVDSSAVVALMREVAQGEIHTFSVGFTSDSYDESSFAEDVARRLGTRHHHVLLDEPPPDEVEGIVAHFGEPFGDASAVATWCLARHTREHVKVALSGDGADELLGGYNRYRAGRALGWLANHPALSKSLQRVLSRIPEGTGYYASDPVKIVKHTTRLLAQVASDGSYRAPGAFLGEELTSLMEDPGPDCRYFDPPLQIFPSLVERMLWADFHGYLPNDIHVKVDRMSMAHGLEVRCPFLDRSVVEWALALPMSAKIRGRSSKRVLRRWLAGRLPEIAGRRKHGFEIPLAAWFRGDLGVRMREMIEDSSYPAFLRREPARRLLARHREREDHSKRLWTLFALLVWSSVHLAGQ